MKKIIIIPTLNEEGNIVKIFNKILKLKLKIDILFIDDNSKDNSRTEILNLKKKNSNIFFLFRDKKKGIGSAHKDGLKFAYEKKYDLAFTIDADGTHEPVMILKMIRFIKKKYDIIILTRFYNKKILLKDWSICRKIFTILRYKLVQFVLDTDLDSTGGFRCFNLNVVKKKDLNLSKDSDYFYLIESLFYLEKLGYTFKQIPCYLDIRKNGSSKLTLKNIIISFFKLFYLRFAGFKFY
jgi:dolichol-phosphate mannosyltransferase